MIPSRPWPRIVRGRMIVTSSAGRDRVVAQQLGLRAWPGRRPRAAAAGVVLVDRVRLRDPEDRARRRVHDLARHPRHAPRGARSRCRPRSPTRTARESLASGTCATLCSTTSTPSHAARTAASVADVALDVLDASGLPGGLRSKMRTESPSRQRLLGEDACRSSRCRPVTRTVSGHQSGLPALEAPADARPHARRTARPAGRSRARPGPG